MIERRVLVRPQADRLVVPRHALQFFQWRHQPAARMQNDGDHTRLFFLVARQRLLNLVAPAVVRRDEAGADQKQDDIGREQMPVDLLLPRCSGIDVPIVPIRNQPGASEHGKMLAKLLPVLLVLVRVRVEDLSGAPSPACICWHPRACCHKTYRIFARRDRGRWHLASNQSPALLCYAALPLRRWRLCSLTPAGDIRSIRILPRGGLAVSRSVQTQSPHQAGKIRIGADRQKAASAVFCVFQNFGRRLEQ